MTIVTAIGMSHSPGYAGVARHPDAERAAAHGGGIRCAFTGSLIRAKPDVMIAFLDDHFENQYRKLMPTFSVAMCRKTHQVTFAAATRFTPSVRAHASCHCS